MRMRDDAFARVEGNKWLSCVYAAALCDWLSRRMPSKKIAAQWKGDIHAVTLTRTHACTHIQSRTHAHTHDFFHDLPVVGLRSIVIIADCVDDEGFILRW